MRILDHTTYFDGFRQRTANILQCDCGEEFAAICMPPAYACDCPGCGQWYNAVGQKLKDPEYWEENY